MDGGIGRLKLFKVRASPQGSAPALANLLRQLGWPLLLRLCASCMPACALRLAMGTSRPGSPPESWRPRCEQADLTTPGSFDAAVAGAQYVIHIASPVHVRVPRGLGLKLLIEPAVAGVENVLGSVAKAGSVEAVVLTGSVAAVFGDTYEKGKGCAGVVGRWVGGWGTTTRGARGVFGGGALVW